jgi:hypothetical protein
MHVSSEGRRFKGQLATRRPTRHARCPPTPLPSTYCWFESYAMRAGLSERLQQYVGTLRVEYNVTIDSNNDKYGCGTIIILEFLEGI